MGAQAHVGNECSSHARSRPGESLGELSDTARPFSGREAYEYGLASHCVPLSDLDTTVTELATAIAENSPESLAAYKDLYLNQQQVGITKASHSNLPPCTQWVTPVVV